MTEKQDVAEKAVSLFVRIGHRLILVIPFLLLSSVIALLLFKYLYEKFGSNFLTASILGIIIMCGIVFLISTTVGRICKDRLFWNSLAYLIPVTVSMEAAIQFGQPVAYVIISTFFFGMLFGGGYTFFAVNYMLSPRVNIEKIKEDKVTRIQIFSGLEYVEKLIDDVLSYLSSTFSRHKTKISDKEIQWVLGSLHYYLSARSHDDNSVDLAFLFFTEGDKELYQSEQNEKDLKFIKGTIEGHLRLDNIECKSIQNPPFQSDILNRVLRKYKRERAPIGKKLRDIGSRITEFYKKYPWIFILIALIYPLINFIRKILKGIW